MDWQPHITNALVAVRLPAAGTALALLLAGCNVGLTPVRRTAEYRTTPERWRGPEPLMATNFQGMLVEIPRAHARVVEERHDRVLLDAPVTDPSRESTVGAAILSFGLSALLGGAGGAFIVHSCQFSCGAEASLGGALLAGGLLFGVAGLAAVGDREPLAGPFSVALDDPLPEDLEDLSGLGLTWEPDVDGPPPPRP